MNNNYPHSRRAKPVYESDQLSKNFSPIVKLNNNTTNILFALPFLIDAGDNHLVRDTIMRELKTNNFNLTIVDTLDISPTYWGFGNGFKKYQQITPDIHHLHNTSGETDLEKVRFLEHLIITRKIDCIFIVGSEFMYDNLDEIKHKYPRVKVIDLQFNAVGHLKNNRKHKKYIDLTITDNILLYDLLSKKYSEKNLLCIPTGVDIEKYNNEHGSLHKKRIETSTNNENLVVSFIGRLSPEKQPELFVDIAKNLHNFTSIHFIIAGDGPMRSQVEKSIRGYQQIEMLGFTNSFGVYQRSDIMLVTSIVEGRPLVLLEAQSMGVPIISTNVGDIPNIIKHYYNGIICQPPTVEEFAKTITQIYNNRDMLSEMSHNSRKYAVENLDIKVTRKSYVDAVRRICIGK